MKNWLILALCLMLALGCAAAEPAGDDGVMREGISSVELTRLMGNGINLGNTLEACDARHGNTGKTPTGYETFWGQPVTTQEMLHAMKAAGFDTIRIPVAWMTNATRLDQGDYTIDPAYMERVAQVVDYARNAGMYVIINDHWDGGWWGMFGSDTAETRALAMEAYCGMWRQIAERFRGYSDYVIFESANEELGARFDENSLYCSDSENREVSGPIRYKLCNEINQAFVDTVRATGGNNAGRYLLIAGYGTNIDSTCDARFVMPTDPAQDKLLVSVHFYDPWTYCGAATAGGATAWGTAADYAAMDAQLAKMKKFVEQGVGVVIGEYGALPGEDGLKANTLAYHTRFLDLCDLYDLHSCLWDTSGLFNRRALRMVDDDVAALYASRPASTEEGMDYADVQAAARQRLDAAMAAAPQTFRDDIDASKEHNAVAWLMWADGSWGVCYSVGDEYQPDSLPGGLKAQDALINGPGVYTVGLDFTGTGRGYSESIAFAAIGLTDGEKLYPGHVIDIRQVLVNGQEYTLTGTPYTTSDNGKCTRVNLYNEWVSGNFTGRTAQGATSGLTPRPLDRNDPAFRRLETITITFELMPQP